MTPASNEIPSDPQSMLIWLQVMQELRLLLAESDVSVSYKLHEGWKVTVTLADGQQVDLPFDPDKLDELRARVVALL